MLSQIQRNRILCNLILQYKTSGNFAKKLIFGKLIAYQRFSLGPKDPVVQLTSAVSEIWKFVLEADLERWQNF